MLKVTVAEVTRSIIKQLGIDLTANLNYGTAVVNFNNSNPLTALGRPLVATNGTTTSFGSSVTATLRAMESAGVVRTLAEPNLTAISGESATFIAGGEFPVPAGYSCDPVTRVCTTQISFKKFGISLNFTPGAFAISRSTTPRSDRTRRMLAASNCSGRYNILSRSLTPGTTVSVNG
jgi:pilus assembly protein CpaC